MTSGAHDFSTARLALRPAGPGDLATLLALDEARAAADPARESRLRRLLAGNAGAFATCGFGLWLVVEGERAVGWVGLRPRESPAEPELYYGLAPDARGRGLAAEAVGAVIDRLLSAPGATGVWAVTDPPNAASRRLLERVGLRLEFEGEFDARPSCVYRLHRAAPPSTTR